MSKALVFFTFLTTHALGAENLKNTSLPSSFIPSIRHTTQIPLSDFVNQTDKILSTVEENVDSMASHPEYYKQFLKELDNKIDEKIIHTINNKPSLISEIAQKNSSDYQLIIAILIKYTLNNAGPLK